MFQLLPGLVYMFQLLPGRFGPYYKIVSMDNYMYSICDNYMYILCDNYMSQWVIHVSVDNTLCTSSPASHADHRPRQQIATHTVSAMYIIIKKLSLATEMYGPPSGHLRDVFWPKS